MTGTPPSPIAYSALAERQIGCLRPSETGAARARDSIPTSTRRRIFLMTNSLRRDRGSFTGAAAGHVAKLVGLTE
jgi:hypothetical protein